MNKEDLEVIQAMEKFGGSFIKALAKAALAADENNLRKIKETWAAEWFKYSALHAAFAAKEVCSDCKDHASFTKGDEE